MSNVLPYAGNCAYFEAAMNHSRSMVAGHVATNGTVHQEVLWSLTRRQPVAVLQDQVRAFAV